MAEWYAPHLVSKVAHFVGYRYHRGPKLRAEAPRHFDLVHTTIGREYPHLCLVSVNDESDLIRRRKAPSAEGLTFTQSRVKSSQDLG